MPASQAQNILSYMPLPWKTFFAKLELQNFGIHSVLWLCFHLCSWALEKCFPIWLGLCSLINMVALNEIAPFLLLIPRTLSFICLLTWNCCSWVVCLSIPWCFLPSFYQVFDGCRLQNRTWYLCSASVKLNGQVVCLELCTRLQLIA